MSGRASGVKMVGMAEMVAPISLDGVAVHPDCLCVCLCYLHFAPEKSRKWRNVTSGASSPGLSRTKSKELSKGCVCMCVTVVFSVYVIVIN